jgi:hypothetical protein
VRWKGSGVVDRFEVKKRSEGGSSEQSTTALAADWEPEAEAWTGGRGGRRLGRGAARHCTAPEVRDGSAGSSEGPGWRCTVVPQWWHGGAVGVEGGGGRKGPSWGSGNLYSW